MVLRVGPRLTVDGVVVEGGMVLLVRRGFPPFRGCWALPGGFVEVGESVEEAVVREVCEETGLKVSVKKLVGVYSDPRRDPRRHTVSACFLCRKLGGRLRSGSDSREVGWFKLDELPELAFDHNRMVGDAVKLTGV